MAFEYSERRIEMLEIIGDMLCIPYVDTHGFEFNHIHRYKANNKYRQFAKRLLYSKNPERTFSTIKNEILA